MNGAITAVADVQVDRAPRCLRDEFLKVGGVADTQFFNVLRPVRVDRFGPVSSAVGMFEPVTTTRSTSAVDGGGAPGSAGTAGAGNCANAFDARINGNPTPAIKARRPNLNVFSAFLTIISFSIGLVRFRQA